MNRNLLVDFTHIYQPTKPIQKDFAHLDMSDMHSVKMYLSDESKRELRKRLARYPISGIHFIDSGDYHYVTEFFVERIHQPFSLILFDHHNDMQPSSLANITTCGSWALEVLLKNQFLVQLILIGTSQHHIDEIPVHSSKLITLSEEEICDGKLSEKLKKICHQVPFYISIDKDVLSQRYALTNWSQGHMRITTLYHFLDLIFQNEKVIGVDIAGEMDEVDGGSDYFKAKALNDRTNVALYRYLKQIGAKKS